MEQYEPNDLLIFARVAEAGSFSRAAERIGLPKSTVSRRVAFLEEQLGERLMLRTTRRLALTEFGLQLLEHARQVAAEVDAVKALSEHRQARPSGRLRVSMPSRFCQPVADRHAGGLHRTASGGVFGARPLAAASRPPRRKFRPRGAHGRPARRHAARRTAHRRVFRRPVCRAGLSG
jgi:DNA-binding transcriptional LysR family regulator